MADIATPYTTNIPNYSQYGTAGLLAKTAYDNTLARINQQRQQSIHNYGYLGDVNANTGVIDNLRVDPNSMFGSYQQMLRGQAGADQQAEFANQDRGLRGGMANKAVSALKYQHGAESAQFGTGFANQFTDYADQLQQATYDRDRALYEAQLVAAQNAISGGDFSPANYGDSPTPDFYGGDPTSGSTGASGTYTNTITAAQRALVKKIVAKRITPHAI
jgi:hypothetical protein